MFNILRLQQVIITSVMGAACCKILDDDIYYFGKILVKF